MVGDHLRPFPDAGAGRLTRLAVGETYRPRQPLAGCDHPGAGVQGGEHLVLFRDALETHPHGPIEYVDSVPRPLVATGRRTIAVSHPSASRQETMADLNK